MSQKFQCQDAGRGVDKIRPSFRLSSPAIAKRPSSRDPILPETDQNTHITHNTRVFRIVKPVAHLSSTFCRRNKSQCSAVRWAAACYGYQSMRVSQFVPLHSNASMASPLVHSLSHHNGSTRHQADRERQSANPPDPSSEQSNALPSQQPPKMQPRSKCERRRRRPRQRNQQQRRRRSRQRSR